MLAYDELQISVKTSPAVNLGTAKAPSWFAAEHLTIIPNQIWARVIPDAVAQDFHNFSCQKPAVSRALIEQEGLKSDFLPRESSESNTGSKVPALQSLVSRLSYPSYFLRLTCV